MVVREPIETLWDLRRHDVGLQVVRHDYRTQHPRKYLGTPMEADNEDYPRKQWSSVMIVNCSHFAWRQITPEAVQKMTGAQLHRFSWMPDEQIGELPKEWNWLCQEEGVNEKAKLLHWTIGTPAFPKYADSEHSEDFRRQLIRSAYVTD